MKPKHLTARIKQCLALAECSPCPRAQFGAIVVDPIRNVIRSEGWNGAPRGGGELCGGSTCDRDDQAVVPGTQVEVGCHHAEMNAICNAAANGTPLVNCWMIVNGEPCRMCAKLIHHAGILKVIVVDGGYKGINGVDYLERHGVLVDVVEK